MNKFIKFIIGAIVALLIVSLVHGETHVARQYGDETPSTADPGKSAASTPSPDASKTTKLPVPDAAPTDVVATADTTYGAASGAASGSPSGTPSAPVPAYSPTGTGSLISQWASLTAKGVPANPTGAPSATAPPKPAETPNSAHKIEFGLINVAVIVGIVSYFY